MARLIDADALYEEHTRLAYKGKYAFHIAARAWLEQAPTVDAVAVVRCKDCKYGSIGLFGVMNCKFDTRTHRYDWFCADGKRKGGDE